MGEQLNQPNEFEGLFMFGFETPAMHEANLRGGWDDELSAFFFVKAPSEQLALRVGGELADRYVKWLWHREARESPLSPTWTAGAFARWLEPRALRQGLEEHEVRVTADSCERLHVLDDCFQADGDEVLPVIVKVTLPDD